MAVQLPRVNISISDARGFDSEGELSTLSLGLGLHQAWIYASMFGTSTMFQTTELFPVGAREIPVASITEPFVVSIAVFILTLLFAGITDQRFLRIYTSKKALRNAAVVTSLGTFLIFLSGLGGTLGAAFGVLSGLMTGIGSGLLLVFWGTAFARHSASSIVLNAITGIVVAVTIYVLLIYAVPNPFAGVLVALLPLIEMPILQGKTPESYILRHEVPIFKPLPVKKGAFCVRFGVPVLLVGFALGGLRSIATQVILPSHVLSANALIVIMAVLVSLVLLVTLLFFGVHRYWDSLFRIIVPLTMLTICFVPASITDSSLVASGMIVVGFICLEALMWIFFGQLCQTFRLSAVFVFGMGRGFLALGSLTGTFTVAHTAWLDSLTPFGQMSGILFYIAALMAAYVALPRVRDIKRMIDPTFEHRYSFIDTINDEAAELKRIVEDVPLDSEDAEGNLVEPTEAAASAASGQAGAGSRGGCAAEAGGLDAEGAGCLADAAERAVSGGCAADAALARRATIAGDFATTAADGDAAPSAVKGGAAEAGEDVGGAATAAGIDPPSAAPSAKRTTAQQAAASRRASATRNIRPSIAEGGQKSGQSGRFRTQCETIANRYLLSRRETEVLFLLAKGHNAAFIQKKLCITQSTAKTHIYHIYQKLDIHTQQELLAMISEALDEE